MKLQSQYKYIENIAKFNNPNKMEKLIKRYASLDGKDKDEFVYALIGEFVAQDSMHRNANTISSTGRAPSL